MSSTEKNGKEAPHGPERAEWKQVPQTLDGKIPRLDRPADDAAVNDILSRWDELDPAELERLEQHPVHAGRLDHLKSVEAWMREQVPEEDACPTAEELYDFGRGPGYSALPEEQRAGIEQRMTACGAVGVCACREMTSSLAVSPPPPLEVGADLEEIVADAGPEHPGRAGGGRVLAGPRPRMRGVLQMAAAAVVVIAGVGLWRQGGSTIDAAGEFPEHALLRGASDRALLFPMGPVLSETGPGAEFFSKSPLFEMSPLEGATTYRVVVRRTDGGAFSGGEEILRLSEAEPVLPSDQPLEPGDYTWEGWALVDGLMRHLGERDFQVVVSAEAADAFELDGVGRVRRLHEAGFLTDARHAARALPASEARDAYLAAHPGR